MDQQRVLLESNPGFVLLCIILGVGYAIILYRGNHPWSTTMNRVLFGIRAFLAFFLAFLLLGPIIRQVNNMMEKPLFVILHDDSGSIREAVDSTALNKVNEETQALQQQLADRGYEVATNNLEGEETSAVAYTASSSDIQGALRRISNRYEGRKFGGVLLVSDGIYNSGMSPLYSSYSFPVYTLGVGDTSQRIDITIKNIAYNKIAYQGNRFPIRVEVLLKGLTDQTLAVSLSHKGNVIDRQTKQTGDEQLVAFDFKPLADEQGIQRYDIQVATHPEEFNTQNNRASIFVEVVEGKKNILLIAAAPHPDIKAIRAAVEKNTNYQFTLHIPGIAEAAADALRPDKADLVILHQVPDQRGRTRALFQQYLNSRTSVFIILGRQTDYPMLSRQNVPMKIESAPRDFDQVTPVINPAFAGFVLESEVPSTFADYPPVSVPFARIQFPLSATVPLWQKIGSVTTDKPLLGIDVQQDRKVAVMLGEGIWRWRLDEFDRTEGSRSFDEFFGKLIQFMSTSDEKKRFVSYPIRQEFSDTEPVIFESQAYNEIFEPVYGNTVNIELTNEEGKKTRYTYVTSPGNTRYQIGGVKEGVYRYLSTTEINGAREAAGGQFAVLAQMAEIQNLTADFDLLRKLSAGTGGVFYKVSQVDAMKKDLTASEATGVIRTEERYDSLINLKWIFWILLLMISAEWFLRKYFGGY